MKRWSGFGIRSVSDMTALPLALLLLAVFWIGLPVSNFVSRQAESAADAYGLKLMGSAEGAVSMHQKLAVSSLSDMDPPLLVSWFRSSHPSDMERILAALAFEKQHRQDKAKQDGQ